MKRLYWWLFVIYHSVRWIPKLNLGDLVRYQGADWMLMNGPAKPLWTIQKGMERIEYIHEREFRKVRTFANYWRSFSFGYHFYMSSWYAIWVNEGVTPWMRVCNIWARG